MKTITVAFTAMTTALLSTSAFATPNVNNCDIELNADMTLNQGVLTVLPDDDKRIVFTPEHTVSVNGNQIKLNNQQQDWANQYYSAINEAVPLTLSLTYDALDLANSAVSEAVGELLGEDDEISQDFRTLFSGLKAELDAHFYDEDGSLRIQTEDFSDDFKCLIIKCLCLFVVAKKKDNTTSPGVFPSILVSLTKIKYSLNGITRACELVYNHSAMALRKS